MGEEIDPVADIKRVQGIVDEMINVVHGLVTSGCSAETTFEYLRDKWVEFEGADHWKVMCFSVIEAVKMKMMLEMDNGYGE